MKMRLLLLAGLSFFLLYGQLGAFEASGTIKGIDCDTGTLQVFSNGKDRTVRLSKEVQVIGIDGQPLADGLKAEELKTGVEVTLSVSGGEQGPMVQTIRLGGRKDGRPVAGDSGKTSVGLTPLTEMTASDRYKGEDGGLYGAGQNIPPAAHLAAAEEQTRRIVPLDAKGNPSRNGKIGLISISMSNATQEYSRFKQIADADPQKSPQVIIVDCAQGGQAMAEWVKPDAHPWVEADRRLVQAGVTPEQVQVVWVKLANKGPRGDLAEHGKKLQSDTLAVLQNASARFPNLRIAYLGSRIYGGYAGSALNPEPYAYEGAFVVRWMIQDQIKGDPELQFSGSAAKAPLLLWGPYFWADGIAPRAGDGLVWKREDLREDGTHPSESGRQKVAEMLLNFFKTDPLASTWFTRHSN